MGEVSPGDPITSDGYNDLWRQSVIPVATVADLPTDTAAGMHVFLQDTFRELQFSVAGWWPVWNQPWGALSIADEIATHSGVVGEIVIASADSTPRDFGVAAGGTTGAGVFPAGRIICCHFEVTYVGHDGGSGCNPRFTVYQDGTPFKQWAPDQVPVDVVQVLGGQVFLQTTEESAPALYVAAKADEGSIDIRGDISTTQFVTWDAGPTGVPVAP